MIQNITEEKTERPIRPEGSLSLNEIVAYN
jgi:hypothetical protein